MTTRSRRRDRELQLIDAAVAWRVAHPYRRGSALEGGGGYAVGSASAKLCDAVDAYCNQELAAPKRTRTVADAPTTSHEAGEWMKQFALTDAAQVFRWIYYAWRGTAGLQHPGMTTQQVEGKLGRAHESISARVNELKNCGWIVDSGETRRTRSGRKAIVWTPSQQALNLVDEHGLPIVVEAP